MLVPSVDVEGGWIGKVFAAVLASVLDAVGEEVPVEALPILESFAAKTAEECPSIRVGSDVLLEVRLDFE